MQINILGHVARICNRSMQFMRSLEKKGLKMDISADGSEFEI